MNNISQTRSQQVEQLLAAYHQDHPFVDKSEHTKETGQCLELYYSDVFTYNKACCEWVQQQMEEQGIFIHIFRLSEGRRVLDSYLYDLIVDKREVIHAVPHQEVYEYALHMMQNQDVYCEHHMSHPETGQSLRKAYNDMESKYAEDGTYIPQYSYGPGPYTSEPQMELNDDTQVQDALRELIEERGYRDATDLLRDFSLFNGRTYMYYCTLQAPDGSPIYCRTPKKVLRVLKTARANNETNASRTAVEPIDSPPWTLVGNFESDDQEEENRE